MSGFQHDIAGGQGNLIIAALQSPNFVHGVSGWSINQDGSAEFRDVELPAGSGGALITIGAVAPSSPHTGDLWLNTGNGLELNQWDGSAWAAYQYGSGAIGSGAIETGNIANAAITNALIAASAVATSNIQNGAVTAAQINAAAGILGSQLSSSAGITSGQVSFTARSIGGITTSVAGTAPTGAQNGDLWFDSSNGYKLNQFEAGSWSPYQFGTSSIQAGSITAALIAANTITAAQIASGTITASQIAANTITASQIASGTITATQIASGTITASLLAANIIVAGIVNGTTITGAQIVADGTSGEFLVYSSTPAAGNLVASISAAAGTDSYGNSYPAGLTSFGSTNQLAPGLNLSINDAAQHVAAFLNGYIAGPASGVRQLGSMLLSPAVTNQQDRAGVGVYSSKTDSSAQAQGALWYMDTSGTFHEICSWGSDGFHVLEGTIWGDSGILQVGDTLQAAGEINFPNVTGNGGVGTVLEAYKTNTTSRTNTSPNFDPDLQISIGAGTIWELEMDVQYDGTANCGLLYTVSGPVGASLFVNVYRMNSANAFVPNRISTPGNTDVASNASTNPYGLLIKGQVQGSAIVGSWSFSWGCNTAGGTMNVRAGSYMKLRRVK